LEFHIPNRQGHSTLFVGCAKRRER
jgi:hypothetical protein